MGGCVSRSSHATPRAAYTLLKSHPYEHGDYSWSSTVAIHGSLEALSGSSCFGEDQKTRLSAPRLLGRDDRTRYFVVFEGDLKEVLPKESPMIGTGVGTACAQIGGHMALISSSVCPLLVDSVEHMSVSRPAVLF